MRQLLTIAALTCIALATTTVKADSSDIDGDVLGAWQLRFTASDGLERTPVVLVGHQYGNYDAWYVGDDEIQPFEEVQLKDDVLVGTIAPKDEAGIKVTVEAKITAENQCEGEGRFKTADGESGAFDFTGKRLSLDAADDVTTWKLSFVTPDEEQHSPTLTVIEAGDKLYAWYSGKDHEMPASDLSLDGDQVTMTLSASTPDGQKVKVKFRGTVNDDEVAGDVEFKVEGETGSFPFTGKRAS
jgi:hypothetical protein